MVKSVIYDQILTNGENLVKIWWKFGENRSGGSWVLFAQRIIL